MEIHNVSYSKVFPLGNYSNEKIGVEVRLAPGENPLDAFAESKRLVEKSHLFFKQLPGYEQSILIIRNPMDYTGREVERAKENIKLFEENFPDYLTRFTVTREITQGDEEEDPDFFTTPE